jgi:hypothetical protein
MEIRINVINKNCFEILQEIADKLGAEVRFDAKNNVIIFEMIDG